MAVISPINSVVAPGSGSPVKPYAVGSPALGATGAVHAAAAVLASGGPQVISTAITNPDVPRNVTATTAGTAGDIKAVQVTVDGTNIRGEVITETLPVFTVDTATTVVGSKAFATVTSYSIPAMDGTGATVAIGTGSKLGLPYSLSRNTVLAAFLNGTKEGTAPTVAVSATAVESNTVSLNSALNGNAVIVDLYL